MRETSIIRVDEVHLRNPILVQGLPGLGYVGKTCVDYLVDKLHPKKFAELHSVHLTFPDRNLGVTIGMDGTYSLPRYEFYAYADGDQNLILLSGDCQPNVQGQYEVGNTVLDFVQEYECNRVVSIGGYGTRSQRDIGTVYAVASDTSSGEKLKRCGAILARTGTITGACGVILGLAGSRKMKGIALLGATRGIYPDLEATRAVVKALSCILNLEIDIGDLDVEIANLKEKLAQLDQIQIEAPEQVQRREETGGKYIT